MAPYKCSDNLTYLFTYLLLLLLVVVVVVVVATVFCCCCLVCLVTQRLHQNTVEFVRNVSAVNLCIIADDLNNYTVMLCDCQLVNAEYVDLCYAKAVLVGDLAVNIMVK